MKVLFITNKVKTYNTGFQNDFEPLQLLGHEVFWAANFTGFIGKKEDVPATLIDLPINSNPFNKGNLKAYKALVKETKKNHIDIILCSTPIGGMLGRLVARKTKTRIIYAAHGLLFFKGAPLINNTVYKLQEKIMAKWTDVIITINNEDYNAMAKIKRKDAKLYLVHGAGVDVDQSSLKDFDINAKRYELCIPLNATMLVSVGFLNKNKNYKVVIEAMGIIKNSDMHYVICGEGEEKESLIKLAKKYGIEKNVHFLGFRTDVFEIMKASNLVIIPSFREGVPRVVLEAMHLGIPCIGSDTRGIRELIGQDFSQLLFDPRSPKKLADVINVALSDKDLRNRVIERNYIECKKYSSEVVKRELYEVYRDNIVSVEEK